MSYVSMFACFTQVLPYQTHCLLDSDTKVGSCVCSTYCLLIFHGVTALVIDVVLVGQQLECLHVLTHDLYIPPA